jgi:hypothetical protein
MVEARRALLVQPTHLDPIRLKSSRCYGRSEDIPITLVVRVSKRLDNEAAGHDETIRP